MTIESASTPTPADVCARFEAIAKDAPLAVSSTWWQLDDGPAEEFVYLEVAGESLFGVPREAFLAAFETAVHELHEGESDD